VAYTPEMFEVFLRDKRISLNFLDALTVHWRAATPGLLEHCAKHGTRVLAWTVDDPVQMQKLIRRGVHGLTTNRIEVLSSLEAPTV
jgi:glycerophosphoryl diester phosphodiesterase